MAAVAELEVARPDPKVELAVELMVFLSLARLLLNQTWTRASLSFDLVDRESMEGEVSTTVWPVQYLLLGNLLPGVDVGVLGLLEVLLQHLQLVAGEGGPRPPHLPLQGEARLSLHVALVAGLAAWMLLRLLR